MPTHLLILAALVAFTISAIMPFAIAPMLRKLGVVDVPNERSSHDRPVLRGLGLGVLVSLAVVGGISTYLFWRVGDNVNYAFLLMVGIFSFFSGVLGFSEDLRGVSVTTRSIILLFIAGGSSAAAVYLGATLAPAHLISGEATRYTSSPQAIGFAELPSWLLVLIAIYGIFFISGFINVANFMDGLNGISGFHAIVAGLTFAVVGAVQSVPWLVVAGVLLAASFAGFLPWNLSGRGAFLGDVGSYLLGGSLAVTSFAALASGVPLLAAIGPLVIYFGDVLVTLISRVRAGFKWDEPHKDHVYQKLQQQGRSHVRVSLIVAGFSAITSLLGVLSLFTINPIYWLLYLCAGLLTLVIYLRLPKLLKKKIENFKQKRHARVA